uniref:Virion structural protein n=1 Tax=Pantoea phage Survivor TaxID=3232176 RepID=A0AAU8KXI9_9CAUD
MLNNVEFKAYILNTIAFARTIVIKCESLATMDNRLMEQHYGIPIPADKAQWRYYLNLNGQYHETDEMMYVQSLDNGDNIEFTKANLDLHLATKRAYREGSYHYSRLVEKYPGQSNLINGIINPIPQSESIPAKDYSILRYNTDYVKWNEYQLIPALQQHIFYMVEGSFKTEYLYTDNLMMSALLANLHGSLISAILSIRKEADGTRYAHDFYIWSRLQSLGLSSVYKSVLDRKQTMWLYRNLKSVLRKLGRRVSFDEVLDIILTHRKIPISRYQVIQTTEGMVDTLKPAPRMFSQPVNLISEFGMDTKVWTVPEVIKKEIPLALDNVDEEPWGISDTQYAITYGLHGAAPSKVLESTMTDTTDRNPDRIMKVLHNEWIYLTFKKIYNINIDVSDVRTGKHFRLRMDQAVTLWHYLIDRARGIKKPGDIPEFNYWGVRKLIPPNWQELQALGHKEILTEEVCKDILKVHIDFPQLISPDAFFQKGFEVADGKWQHKKLYSAQLNLFIASRRQNACDALYENGLAKLTDIKTYDDFLLTLDLELWDYTADECLDLAWAIWEKATGWEYNNSISIGEQQRLLINLMKDLTSYTVQYIGSTETLAGQYNLPYMTLLDGDWLDKDGETGLESDGNGVIIPAHGRGFPVNELVAKELKGYIPGDNWGRTDPTSIGCARIYAKMYISQIDSPPVTSGNHISNFMTVKEAKPDESTTL